MGVPLNRGSIGANIIRTGSWPIPVRGVTRDNMRTCISVSVIVSAAMVLAACNADVKPDPRPDWIDNPGDNFVGRCATHIRGPIAQEECAYRKGLAYMAMSKGVTVDVSSRMTMKQTATQKTGSSYGKVEATVNMDEKNIRVGGTIIDKWHDRVSDIMYVLIEAN